MRFFSTTAFSFFIIANPMLGHTKTIPTTQNDFEQNAIIIKGSKKHIAEVLLEKGLAYKLETIDSEDDIYLVRYQGKINPNTLSKDLSTDQRFEFVEPNFRVHKEGTPKDPLLSFQWALKNQGQDSPHGLPGIKGADINAKELWKIEDGNPEEVIVAVLDTGIDYEHPDLKSMMWTNKAELSGKEKGTKLEDDDGNGWPDDVYGWNFISDTRTKPYGSKIKQLGHPDPMDDHSHGTHCAGIIAAKSNNIGSSGIAQNVKLMALKFLDSSGRGHIDDAARGVLYAIKNKASVISMSFGSTSFSKTMFYELKKAEKAGLLLVAAAGNSSGNNDEKPHYPSNYEIDSLVSVAATDNRDRLALFSNYGRKTVHIGAPGVDIMSTINEDGDITTEPYHAYSGTSMAAPLVAGAAAVLLGHQSAVYKGKPLEVKKALMASVDKTEEMMAKVTSGGRLDIGKLLDYKNLILTSDKANKDAKYQIVEEQFELKSYTYPNWYPVKLVDHVWTVSRQNAHEIRVFFEEFKIDYLFDLFALYNKHYLHLSTYVKPFAVQEWSPWVKGDTLKIRFANATVQIIKKELKEFANADEARAAGGTQCKRLTGSNRVKCYVMKKYDPTPNHESGGFSISKLQYKQLKPIKVEESK